MQHQHVTAGLFAKTLRSKPEDAITEVLAALLRSEVVGLKVLLALLPGKRALPQQVLTQWCGEDGSRPDLLLLWQGEAVVIEVKFRAPLQPGQRDGYGKVLEQLKREVGSAALYFLAPAWRRNEIERETITLERKPIFISWWDVANALADIHADDEIERVWLQELIEAIDQEASHMYELERIEQDELDLLSKTGPVLAKCLNLVDRLYSSLDESAGGNDSFVPKPRCTAEKAAGQNFAYGFYLRPVGDIWGWIGFYMLAWRMEPHSPLGIQLRRPKRNDKLLTAVFDEGRSLDETKGWESLWIPLRLSSKEPADLVEDLQRQLGDIYARLPRR